MLTIGIAVFEGNLLAGPLTAFHCQFVILFSKIHLRQHVSLPYDVIIFRIVLGEYFLSGIPIFLLATHQALGGSFPPHKLGTFEKQFGVRPLFQAATT
jgi:hypothetical protein